MEPGRAGNTDNFLHFQEYSIILFLTIPTVHRIIFVIQKFISDLKNANFINHYVNMEIHNTNSKQGNHIHLSFSYGEAGVTKRGISITTKCVVGIEWNFAVGLYISFETFWNQNDPKRHLLSMHNRLNLKSHSKCSDQQLFM